MVCINYKEIWVINIFYYIVNCPCFKVSVITPFDTTMPSDASAVVPVNVATGCLIHKRCVSFFNAVTVSSNDAVILFVRSPAF